VKKDIDEIRYEIKDTKSAVQDISLEQKREKIVRWLSPPDPSTNYNKALQQRQEGTGLWLLQSRKFADWKTQRNSSFWLYGMPGCGKTILSSTVVEGLSQMLATQPLYFYFDFNDVHKQTLENMIRSFLIQLCSIHEDAWKPLISLFSTCSNGQSQPTCESLCRTLIEMMDSIEEIHIVLDALDECRTRKGASAEGLISWIRDLLGSAQRNVHLFLTSRPEQDIKTGIYALSGGYNMPVDCDSIGGDICQYVHARVRGSGELKRWRTHPDVQNEIETCLVEKANGM
jgi:hypothetical protein